MQLRDEVHESAKVPVAKLRQYFFSNARIWLGREQRLSNGVAWRLQTDVGSNASAPRITWMADRQAMLRANRLFEAIHGLVLLDNEAAKFNGPQDNLPTPYHPTTQTEVAVTYASSRWVSYVELGWEASEGTAVSRILTGRVLDLEEQTYFSIKSCFGNLLEICDDTSAKAFEALRAEKTEAATKANRDPGAANCAAEMARSSHAPTFFLYLTQAVLAIHDTAFTFSAVRFCALARNRINPAIIPYRDLAPFMKPGPLKDELLAAEK